MTDKENKLDSRKTQNDDRQKTTMNSHKTQNDERQNTTMGSRKIQNDNRQKKTTMQIYKIVTNTDPIKYIGIKNKSS